MSAVPSESLRSHLVVEMQDAEEMARIFEQKIKANTLPPWEDIQLFAYWTARLALARDRWERFGFKQQKVGV